MKEVLFVCCNMRCADYELSKLASESFEPKVSRAKWEIESDGTRTRFVAGSSVDRIRGMEFDEVKFCDRASYFLSQRMIDEAMLTKKKAGVAQ